MITAAALSSSIRVRLVVPRGVPRTARSLAPLLFAALLCVPHVAASAEKQGYRLGERLAQKSGTAGAYKETPWEALVPSGWNPSRELGNLDLGRLGDADPRAIKALEKLREAWDKAPVATALNGTRIRIAGFLVPLDVQNRRIAEFLLVPYFGACIHTPPPPANQIIHVVTAKPLIAEEGMTAVWISGTLETVRSETGMGNAGYFMRADRVEPYRGGK